MNHKFKQPEIEMYLVKNGIVEINGYIVQKLMNDYKNLTKKRFLQLYRQMC